MFFTLVLTCLIVRASGQLCMLNDPTCGQGGGGPGQPQAAAGIPPVQGIQCKGCDDPHHTSWDGTRFDYHSTCRSALVMATPTCDIDLSDNLREANVPQFEVVATNRVCGNGAGCIDKTGVFFPEFADGAGLTITMTAQGCFRITVGTGPEELINDPCPPAYVGVWNCEGEGYDCDGHEITFGKVGNIWQISTDFGLTVWTHQWGCHGAKLSQDLAALGQNQFCGICGKFDFTDDETHTEFMGLDYNIYPPLTATRRVLQEAFSKQFANVNDPPGCRVSWPAAAKVPGTVLPACDPDIQAEAEKICGPIKDPNGPFGGCLAQVKDVEAAFEDCVFDMCIAKPGDDFVCENFYNFAMDCAKFVPLPDWRKQVYDQKCVIKCDKHQVYSYRINNDCAPTCLNPKPCQDPLAFPPGGFLESCACNNKNHFWDGTRCAHRNSCKAPVPCRGVKGRRRKICLKRARAVAIRQKKNLVRKMKVCDAKDEDIEKIRCSRKLVRNDRKCKGLPADKLVECMETMIKRIKTKPKPKPPRSKPPKRKG